MAGDEALWAAALAAIAGVALLRWSWSRRGRLALANAAGWLLLLLATVLSASAAGAWGVAVAALVSMLVALVLLAVAAARSQPGRRQASLDRRVKLLDENAPDLALGRRFATFAIVVLGGLAASVALAVGLRAATLGIGWSEADANAMALFSTPLTWSVLATVLLMQARRSAQFTTLALAALPVLPALLAGS